MARRKPRKARPKKSDYPKGYDSGFEYTLHQGVLQGWKLHPGTIPYTVEKKYYPDFVKEVDGVEYLLESKGRFWSSEEASKYIHIRSALEESGRNVELIFLFYNPRAPMPRAKKRKDGTKMTHAEWADKNGFSYFSEDNFPEEMQ